MRQPRVVVEQQRREADERERLARQIADRFRHRLLHLADVVVDARQQPAGGAVREERRPTGPRMWRYSALRRSMTTRWPTSAIRYDETYEPMPFSRYTPTIAHAMNDDVLLLRQHVVEDRLDELGAGRPMPIA